MRKLRCVFGIHKVIDYYKRYRVIGPDQWYIHIVSCEECGWSKSEFHKVPVAIVREFERENNVR